MDKETIEREWAQQRIEHLNGVLRAIRNVDHLIVHEKDPERLLKRACDTLIETRSYYNAWIALIDDSGQVVATTQAGLGDEFIQMAERLRQGEFTTCGYEALRQSELVTISDPPIFCTDCPLAIKYQGRAAMTMRLEHEGKVYGLMSASIPADFLGDEEEESLFEQVAGDIAFALHDIELQEAHRQAEEKIRIYARQVTQAQEDERKRISLELHDETAQELIRLGMDIDSLVGAKSEDLRTGLEELRNKVEEVLQGVRRLSQELRPPMLDALGLIEALRWLIDDPSVEPAISASFKIHGDQRRLSPEAEMVLFRIVQESLNNVRKHSQATEIKIELQFHSEKIDLAISDNGQGFELPRDINEFVRIGKLGLIGMQERAKLLGGIVVIQSEPGKGTIITAELRE